MTCWLCHGSSDSGRAVLGLPGRQFDYGLLLATAAVLDDGNATAAAYRRARGFPAGTDGARAAAPGGARAAGSDRRVRPRCHRAHLSFGTLRGDRPRASGNARHRQPDQRPRHPRRARARAGELVRLGGRGGALAGTTDRPGGSAGTGRIRDVRHRLLGSWRRPARPAVRSAQPRHARAAARFVCRPALVRRHLRPRRAVSRHDEGDPFDVCGCPVRQTVLLEIDPMADFGVGGRPERRSGARRARRAIFAERIVGTIVNRRIFKRAPRAYAAAKIEDPCWRRSTPHGRSTRS